MNTNIISFLERTRQVKAYICQSFSGEDPALEDARRFSEAQGLKPIHVPPNVGKMLYLLARLQNVKKILEIGTLGGYSTLWLAKALPADGRLITLECEKKHVEVAKKNFKQNRMDHIIEIRYGLAENLMNEMILSKEDAFDLIFIDADKASYAKYLEFCLQLSRVGTVILSDNLIPKRGEISNPDPSDIEAVKIYAYNELVAKHPRLEMALFPTIVGENGRIDALGVAIVK